MRRPQPELPTSSAQRTLLWERAQHIFEYRCVVCHGCYDAPCQIKLESFAGIDRGGSPEPIYAPSRLTAATPTRLDVDAEGAAAWRELDFYPILPEGTASDPRASLLLRAVRLGREHPLAPNSKIGREYEIGSNRVHRCPTAQEFDTHAQQHPTWGMPFALPALTAKEEQALIEWVRAGAPHTPLGIKSERTRATLKEWEHFLNQASNKGKLVARFVYEHLFLASIRFDDGTNDSAPQLFRMVRSKTPTGAVDEINTRRPFDDPGEGPIYYRFVLRDGVPLDKTLMPYALNQQRLERYRQLFFDPAYEVDRLPGYDAKAASNPFRTFEALPVTSRYRFMLEEAAFTLMGFIKGPVCRGQVALDVIDDRFFVFFVDPDSVWLQREATFLAQTALEQEMPAASGSDALPTAWLAYGEQYEAYSKKKAEYLAQATRDGQGLTERSVWNGDGRNDNAALTVFRHFDSATVVKGLVGPPTKTLWLVDYPLLERIHYLLVAGFDVFGNVGHQLGTRLYMDYLRMEAEAGFLNLLPPEGRKELVAHWYRGLEGERKTRIERELIGTLSAPDIRYTNGDLQTQALQWLQQRVASVAPPARGLEQLPAWLAKALRTISAAPPRAAALMRDVSFVVATDDLGQRSTFTIIRDNGHSNIAEPFDEQGRRLPSEDRLVLVSGLLGAYPNALFAINEANSDAFAAAVGNLNGDVSYRALRERFGVSRSSPQFWRFSDQLQSDHIQGSRIEHGLLDYTRLDPN